MPINFPDSPSLNQTYTFNGITWTWNGLAWTILPISGYSGVSGAGGGGGGGGSGYSGYSGYSGFGGPGASGYSGAPALNWTKITSNTTAVPNTQYILDTSGGTFTVNLPAGPVLGSTVVFSDGWNLSTTPVTIGRNGSTIEGTTNDVSIDYTNLTVWFIYDGTTWQISATTGPIGLSGYSGIPAIEVYTNITSTTFDLSAAEYFSKTITGTTSLVVSNIPAPPYVGGFILELVDGGSATVNWWSGVKWAGGTPPTLTVSGTDILGFYTHDSGTTWRGFMLAKDSK